MAFQSEVRFGFAAFTGVLGATCPLALTRAGDIAIENYAAIDAALAPLGAVGAKAESPTAAALATIRPTLVAESGTEKAIFLITPGGDDFCDDGDPTCASDAVVSELQQNFTAGIRGSLFSLNDGSDVSLAWAQAQANAGAGLLPVGPASNANIYLACAGVTAWHALWTSDGDSVNQPLGTYAATAGDLAAYATLDTTAPASVTAALMNAVAAQRSCTFDLASGHLAPTSSENITVSIDGANVPEDANNGFRVNNTTELELRGTTCTSWRSATPKTIKFDVPCSIFVP